MEDSSVLSPISLLTIATFLFILNLMMIIQDFSSSFPYSLHLFFSNAYILFASSRNKKLNIELPIARKIFVPTQAENKMSVKEVKTMIDDSEALYERLIGEGEEYLLDKSEMMGKEIVKKAFILFDQNKDGFIDENELKHVLSLLGYDECTKMDCRKMIRVFDENRDGNIDFNEFVKLIDKSFS
ncbi:putative calcium-binding protein CML47 [Raphanus sativus]|uniref:Probable calcium-binding protein CML47 n=1 Tax=Raphanus sativus TaxID=3726 RepID=A0A6J0JN14_RAPSA|nr:probable calcium-binding protein CML47 [Raphanus sativus]KAJ4890421.1 putative calcium-binding protein CML47 [Raphanus sativus]